MQSFRSRRALRAAMLAALLGAALAPTLSLSPVHADSITPLAGAAGLLQPPAAALAPNGVNGNGARGLGLVQTPGDLAAPRFGAMDTGAPTPASLPASADISQYNPPVGSQGSVASCASWVTAYYMRGWYARRDGYYPSGGADGAGSFAPMYLFNQITGGQNTGTTFNANLDMMTAQGVDTRADYTQGDTDYADAPSAAEHVNAAPYKIAGYNVLFQGTGPGPSAQQEIEAAIAGGNPVAIGIPIYDNFWNASSTAYYIDGTPGTNHGNHAVFATKYDANGVWIENQWGTWWGLNGWAELSWAFVEQYAWQALTMTPLTPALPSATATSIAPPPPPTATTAPVLPPPTATATPVPALPTATATSVPVVPTATHTALPLSPTATATPVPTAVPPTATSIPPTATPRPVPPTATPRPRVRPVRHNGDHPARARSLARRLHSSPTVIVAHGRAVASRHIIVSAHLNSQHAASGMSVGRRIISDAVGATGMVPTKAGAFGVRDAVRRGASASAWTGPLSQWLGPWRSPRGPVSRVVTRLYGAPLRLGPRLGRAESSTVAFRDTGVAARARRVTLRFSYHALTVARHGLVPLRQSWLEVDVLDRGTHRLLARAIRPGAAARQHAGQPAAWRVVEIDLTRFCGRRLRLVFRDHQFAPGRPVILDLAGVRVTSR